MANILITGGGRGLGLELARQFLQVAKPRPAAQVYVTTRAVSNELQRLIDDAGGRLANIHCEPTSDASVARAAAELEGKLDGKGLDVLVNNVGVISSAPNGIQTMTAASLLEAFDVNVGTTQRITAALLPALRRSREKKIIMISTTLGSVSLVENFALSTAYQYKITKAALGMLAAQYALSLGKDGFTVLLISPGWLRTDMGSQHADLDVSVGAQEVRRIILEADATDNGKFRNILVPGWENAPGSNQYDGGDVPW